MTNAALAADSIQLLPVDQIQPNPWNRNVFDQAAMEELVASIRSGGIEEPLIVRKIAGGRFEIASGERRWRAARKAGLEAVPCLVRDLSDEKVAEMNVEMNVQRENLPVLELARMVHEYLHTFKKKQTDAAITFGKSEPWISELIGFLSLDPLILEKFKALNLGWVPLRALKVLPAELQRQLAKEVSEGITPIDKIAKRCSQLRFTPKVVAQKNVKGGVTRAMNAAIEDRGFQFEWRGAKILMTAYIDIERIADPGFILELQTSLMSWMNQHPQPASDISAAEPSPTSDYPGLDPETAAMVARQLAKGKIR